MSDAQPTRSPWPAVVSWAALGLACVTLAAVAVFIPADRPGYVQLFHDFKVEVPAETRAMIDAPPAAFPAVAAVLAAAAVAAQWVTRRRGGATSVHLAVTLAAVVAFAVYRDAMLRPFAGILWAVTGPQKH